MVIYFINLQNIRIYIHFRLKYNLIITINYMSDYSSYLGSLKCCNTTGPQGTQGSRGPGGPIGNSEL